MRFSLLLVVAIAVTGCSPRVFDRLKDDSPVIALSAPDADRDTDFGAVMTTYVASFSDGRRVSRIAATGGPNTEVGVFGVWGPNGMELRSDALFNYCGELGSCRLGVGSAITGVTEFNGQQVCTIVGEPTDGALRVICESMPGSSMQLTPIPGSELGQSIAGIPAVGHPVGVAIVGAPGDVGGEGRLYALPDAANVPVVLPVPAEIVLAAGHRLGQTIALHQVDASTVLVAASAPGAGRVALLRIDAGPTVTALACIDRVTPGFGAALAFGDLDNDGDADLAIGSEPNAVGRSEDVLVFDTASLTGADGCTAPATASPVATISCIDGMRDATCAGAAFGGSLAIGDVDLDGFGDLLVGAPRATVSGKAEAGAAFLFAGSSTGADPTRVDVLVHTHPGRNDNLGAQVGMTFTHLDPMTDAAPPRERVEPVLSAPGLKKLYVFLCTSLEQGDPSFANRCLD